MDGWMMTLFQAVGGIGVFLLALDMLTQGLRLASGNALQAILARWTDTPVRGLFFGFVATAVLQSSSVVTAIVISLVNAAIMPLNNAIWTVFGANIGTTLTGWLVSATGFDINLKALALPFVGVGMLMKLLTRRAGWRAAGMALAGIGLFFLGIGFLKDAFSAYGGSHDFGAISQDGFISLLALVGVGIVMTVIIQSSTAAMVIILTGAASGMLTLSAGAALVIGANLGTTSTAIIAGIGASPNAKRTSAVHVIFNVVTAAVVLPLLPVILGLIHKLEVWAGFETSAAVSLAIFHTAFSVIGVIVFWPFVPAMTRWLERRFVHTVDNESKPRYLDRAGADLPVMAIGMLGRELARLQRKTAQHALAALAGETHAVTHQRDVLLELSNGISSFAGEITQENMDPQTVDQLQAAYKINRHLAQCLSLSGSLAAFTQALATLRTGSMAQIAADKMMQRIQGLLDMAVQDKRFVPRVRHMLLKDYTAAKEALLQAGMHKEVSMASLSSMMDTLSRAHRAMEQLVRADRNLMRLRPEGEMVPEAPAPVAETPLEAATAA